MKHLTILAALFLGACASGGGGNHIPPSPAPAQNWTITNGTVIVMASAAYGGSVVSVIDGSGKQYVDTVDHGREFQIAYQLDDLGEGENPTEAGSAADANGPTSSTVILGVVLNGPNVFTSVVHPAYWNGYNGTIVSPDTISKTVTVGYNGLANVIRFDVQITTVGDHTKAQVEGLTGYGPVLPVTYLQQGDGSFIATGQTQSWGMYKYSAPIIQSSVDGSQAVGVYSPGDYYLNVVDWPGASVNKWDCAYWIQSPFPAGIYKRTCYVAVGTFAEVEASLIALFKM